jgi:hypothetical protein
MTEDSAQQPVPAEETGKLPIGFWWIAIGIILVLCGLAIVISVLPQLLDGSIMAQSSQHYNVGIYFIGPLLPGLFAIGYGLSLRKKAGVSLIPLDKKVITRDTALEKRAKTYYMSIFILGISEVWMTISYAPKILAFFLNSPSDDLLMWHLLVYGIVTIAFAAGIIYFYYQVKKIQKETGKNDWSL